MNLLESMIQRAQGEKQRIVLPEGTEPRTLEAADRLLRDGVAEIILLGKPEMIREIAREAELKNIEGTTIIHPGDHEKKGDYTNLLLELRSKKGMTAEQASLLVEDPLYLACLMIKNGDADGEVAGAENTTGDVLRPALQIIRTLPGGVGGIYHVHPDTSVWRKWHTPICRLCGDAQSYCRRAGIYRRFLGTNGQEPGGCGAQGGDAELLHQRECRT
mgnify:CR=1 FL=1